MKKLSFWKVLNVLMFFGLVVLSVIDITVMPVLIAYSVIWILFQVKLSEVSLGIDQTQEALSASKIFQSIANVLTNLTDMVGMIGDRIILEGALSDDPDNEEDKFNALTDQPVKYIPKMGQHYWYVSSLTNEEDAVMRFPWDDDAMDHLNLENNNCFRTKKEAKQAYDKILAVLRG